MVIWRKVDVWGMRSAYAGANCEEFSMENGKTNQRKLTSSFSVSQHAARVMQKNGYGKIIKLRVADQFFRRTFRAVLCGVEGRLSRVDQNVLENWASHRDQCQCKSARIYGYSPMLTPQ